LIESTRDLFNKKRGFNKLIDKLSRFRSKMREQKLSALIVLSVENVIYFIGTMIPSHETSKTRRVITIIPEDKDPILLVAEREALFAEQYSNIKDIRTCRDYKDNPIDILNKVLNELNLSGKKIGVEMEAISAKDFLSLQEYTKGIKLEIRDATNLLSEMRSIKTPAEIELLRKICKLSEETIQEVFSSLKPGMKEKDVEVQFTNVLSAKGAKIKKARFGSGENTGVGNPEAGERVLRKGDLFRTDFMGNLAHYYSDIARTGVIGKPKKEYIDIWSKLYETHMRILQKVKPGILASDLYGLYKKEFKRWEFPPVAMVGHGIGLLIHEFPTLNDFNNAKLKKGMVLSIEEDYIVSGDKGLHIEDTILVKENGYELFSNKMDTSSLFIVEL